MSERVKRFLWDAASAAVGIILGFMFLVLAFAIGGARL